jgi:ParB family chromosome partitioning protein
MAKKRILGTDKLFEETEAVTAVFAEQEEAVVQQRVSINRIVPNRFNPRQVYSRETLDELIRSIHTYGFIGALDGRELADGRVELAYGSRRLLAAKAAALPTLPVFLHDWDDDQMRFIALVENLAREDLTPIDEANTVAQMREALGLSTRDISQRIGKPRSWVQDRLALYEAPEDVKHMVLSRPDTLRAARFIARLPNAEDRVALQDQVLGQEITTRQVQLAVQQIEEGTAVTAVLASVTAPPPQWKTAHQQADRDTAGFVPPDAEMAQVEMAEDEGPSGLPLASSVHMDAGIRSSPQVFEQEVPFPSTLSTLHQPPGVNQASTADARTPASGHMRTEADQGWPSSGIPLIVLACEALDSFDPASLSEIELDEAIEWLRQLCDGAGTLIKVLERLR